MLYVSAQCRLRHVLAHKEFICLIKGQKKKGTSFDRNVVILLTNLLKRLDVNPSSEQTQRRYVFMLKTHHTHTAGEQPQQHEKLHSAYSVYMYQTM